MSKFSKFTEHNCISTYQQWTRNKIFSGGTIYNSAPKVEILRCNLTKYVQNPYAKNYKVLIKETKGLNKWREMPHSPTGRLIIVKISIFPHLIYRFNVIPIKVPMVFVEMNKQDSKMNMERQWKKPKQVLKTMKLEESHY